jgi:GPH family glycoside/pentoside/hexuronide:cation symporter
MTYRSAMQKVFEVANFYALRFTNLSWFLVPATGKQNVLLGMQVYTCILGTIMAIFAITIFLRVKERYYEKIVVKSQERISLKSAFYETLTCRPFLFMLLVGASFNLGTSMLGTLGYYATVFYVCAGNTALGNDWNFWMGLSFMFGGLIGAPVLNRVAYYFGKRNALIATAFIGIIAYVSSWFLYNPNIQWLQTVASGLMGLTASGLWMLYGSICADVIDYDELHTGKRREGSFTSCGTYILKLGNSLGGFLAGACYQLDWWQCRSPVGSARNDFLGSRHACRHPHCRDGPGDNLYFTSAAYKKDMRGDPAEARSAPWQSLTIKILH